MSTPVDLTIEEAAEVLNVSSAFVVGLLDSCVVPFDVVDGRRRLKMPDVLTFKRADDREREAVLDELTAEAQKNGLGY